MSLNNDHFIYLALFIGIIGGLIYLKDTITGRVKPNRVSYFFWFLLPTIAFAAELDKGVGLTAYYTLLNGIGPLCILLATFAIKDAYWKLERVDYVMGGLALISVILWQRTGEGNLAIGFVILADALASIPTIRKSYKSPETENIVPYSLSLLAATITTLSVPVWNFAHYGFPLYLVIISASIVGAIALGKQKQNSAVSPITPN